MALIIEGSILIVIGIVFFLIGNETIRLKPSSSNEQIVQYASVGGTLAVVVGLIFLARGFLM